MIRMNSIRSLGHKAMGLIACLVLILLNVSIYGNSEISPNDADKKNPGLSPKCIKNWSKAGVTMKPWKSQKTLVINPENSIQESIEILSKSGGGVLILNSGEYIIRETIRLRSNVILRGCNKDSVLLSVKIHGFHYSTGQPRQSALLIDNKHWVGIENLTIKYTDAAFEPLDKDSMTAPWDKAVFHQPELRDTSLFVEHIWIDHSKNCWIKNCNLLWAGSDPIRITNSKHITCCNNYIDRSYNKNDGGMGYYNIINSKYVLVFNETIKRIRHLTIQKGSKYNVVYNNYIEVDINFHDEDKGFNLIESNTIRIPEWHSWHCFQHGDPKQHEPPGKMNVLFNNNALHKNRTIEYSEKGKAYLMNSSMTGKSVLPTDWKLPDNFSFYHPKN